MTAYTDEDTLQRAKITEPFGYLVKPFETRELCSTVEIALYKHQLDRKLRQNQVELAAIFSGAPIMMMLVDRERRIRKVNRATVESTNRSAEAIWTQG